MRWSRVRPRRQPSCADPVGIAVAEVGREGPLESRLDDEVPDLAELPGWIEVQEVEGPDGLDTAVHLDDEIHGYVDPLEDGLVDALNEQRGISRGYAEDRGVIYLASRLALVDVHACVVRAVAEVNRRPRVDDRPVMLSDATVLALASGAAHLLIDEGFTQKDSGIHFYRVCDDGFVQTVAIHRGVGSTASGVVYEGLVDIWSGIYTPDVQKLPYGQPSGPDRVAPAHHAWSREVHVPPTADALGEALCSEVLPWLRGTTGKDSLADWVGQDPARVEPVRVCPLLAELLARWGYPEPALRLLHRLEGEEPYLRLSPQTQEARRLLGAP